MKIEVNGLGRGVALRRETTMTRTTEGDGLNLRPND
jgi:hypothetical protein